MNYLAHIFLSGNNPKIQLGNFIGDAVKGSSYNNYPREIAEGILLHRAIDTYTDNHPVVKNIVDTLRPEFGRYSAVLSDIYFDHLLASRFNMFSDIPLRRFTRNFYITIIKNYRILPSRMKNFMWHFIGTDRLGKYATKKGIRRSLDIMTNVHSLELSVDLAIDYLTDNEQWLFDNFEPFFSDLRSICNGYLQTEDRSGYLNEHIKNSYNGRED